MMINNKKSTIKTIIISVVIIFVFVSPFIAGEKKYYFDCFTGKLKVQRTFLNIIISETIKDTEYSKFIKKYDINLNKTQSKWEKTCEEEIGLNRLFYPQSVSYKYGKIENDAKQFCKLLNLKILTDKEKLAYIIEFQKLVELGEKYKINDYIETIDKK